MSGALLAPTSLAAVPVEFGVAAAAGQRQANRFDRGMQLFRSTLSPTVLNVVEAQPFRQLYSIDAFVRFGAFDDAENFLGLALGRYYMPDIHIREARSDVAVLDLQWGFDIPYGLLTYHHVADVPFADLGAWQYEAGFGFGFVPGARWRASGLQITRTQLIPYSGTQTSGTGNMARVELGLRRPLSDHVFIRTGLRASYVYLSGWDGEINGATGAWAYLRNGGIVPISSVNFVLVPATVFDPALGFVQAPLVRERADVPSGILEWQLSVGMRF